MITRLHKLEDDEYFINFTADTIDYLKWKDGDFVNVEITEDGDIIIYKKGINIL